MEAAAHASKRGNHTRQICSVLVLPDCRFPWESCRGRVGLSPRKIRLVSAAAWLRAVGGGVPSALTVKNQGGHVEMDGKSATNRGEKSQDPVSKPWKNYSKPVQQYRVPIPYLWAISRRRFPRNEHGRGGSTRRVHKNKRDAFASLRGGSNCLGFLISW